MKNPHGVEPTRFMKRKDSEYAIVCNADYGPDFGNIRVDIALGKKFNEENRNSIWNDGTNGYECHPKYKRSLFVNTAGPNEGNRFSVLDIEVFGIDYGSKYTIDHICMYPDIIWKYIETKDISEESLKQFDDDTELLNNLDAIHCDDSNIRLKISRYYFKNPSKLLPDTQIVDKKYDAKLREWVGDYKWKLLYRASEHGYTAKSFHECCNNKGPTLIVIKSSGGWIFGGYTTQSWSGGCLFGCIYNDMI